MNYQYHYVWDRIAGRDPNLRAADADRERIADRLRKAHAEGRLDTDELQQRLEACYEAKAFGQLDQLVRDLPRDEDQIQLGRLTQPSGWRGHLTSVISVVIALLIASALVAHHVFWLWIPLLFVFWRSSRRRRRRLAGPRPRPSGRL
jgi:Flp pilus assembly protein TadB